MPTSEYHIILLEMARQFEVLATQLEREIQAFADDDCATIDVAALRRCREGALRGAMVACNAISNVSDARSNCSELEPTQLVSEQTGGRSGGGTYVCVIH